MITDEQCSEAYKAYVDNGGNKTHAAKSLGMKRKTYTGRLKIAYARNIDQRYNMVVPEGTQIISETKQFDSNGEVSGASVKVGAARDGNFKVPKGHAVKGISSLVDGNGNVIQTWYKTHADKQSVEDTVAYLKDAFTNFVRPHFGSPDLPDLDHEVQTLYPLPDLHLGLFAWGKETGEDWDLKIAINRYEDTMRRVAASSASSNTAILLGGGDMLHMDNSENRTAKSGNVLDVDTRYSKVLAAACNLLVYQIELLLEKHQEVRVRMLPGNHDEHSTVAITWFLKAWYRNVPAVHIDVDPSLFWWHKFGKVLLGATHGHAAKVGDMPMIMANRVPEQWGSTVHRYVHGFHIHHKTKNVFEGGGVITETHQAPVVQDAWHSGMGYLSGRSMQSISYHEERGEISRTRVAL